MEVKQCKYCLSEIPQKAEKCRFCMEWQDESTPSEQIQIVEESGNLSTKFTNIKIPFQLAIVKRIPLHYAVSILIFCVLIFMAVQVSWYKLNEDKIYLLSFLTFTIQMFVSWTGLVWVYDIINDNYFSFLRISSLEQSQAEKKLLKFHNLIFHRRNSILAGIVVGLIASIGDYYVGAPFNSLEAKLIFASFEFFNMFLAGAAIYSMFMFAIFIRKISYNPCKDKLHLDKNSSIMNVGAIHLKTSVLAIVPLFLGVVAKLFGNWDWNFLIIIWYVSFAVIIILYIYWPMLYIHRLLQNDIESQVIIIQKKSQKLLIDISTNPSSRNFTKLNELRELEKSISSQNTWPFDTKSLSAAFFAIIFPIVLIVIEKIWNA